MAVGAQVLVGVGKAHHPAGTADAHHLMARLVEAGFDGVGRGEGHILAVIDDQSDAGHRSVAEAARVYGA